MELEQVKAEFIQAIAGMKMQRTAPKAFIRFTRQEIKRMGEELKAALKARQYAAYVTKTGGGYEIYTRLNGRTVRANGETIARSKEKFILQEN